MNDSVANELLSPVIGPVIGLVHGWAMHGGLFEDLRVAWPDPDWRRLDLPGHGLNRDEPWPEDSAALAGNIADRLPEGAWLAGWSLGGLLSLQAALACPGHFSGLVLIAATPRFLSAPDWPWAVEPALLQAMALELAGDSERVVDRFLALEVHGAANARDELRRLKSLALVHGLPDRDALVAGLKHLGASDERDRLPSLDLPVLMLGGRRDRLVPFEALERTAALLPRARLEPIPGAAHAPFLTDPHRVAERMREFIAEVSVEA